MALELAFTTLLARLHVLNETLVALHTTIAEDHPLDADSALVEIFGTSAEDLIGWIVEAQGIARDGWQAIHAGHGDTARRALAGCQEDVTRVVRRLLTELMHYERMGELMRFGRMQGGEWRAWAHTVRRALDGCQEPLFATEDALFACWQEFASHHA